MATKTIRIVQGEDVGVTIDLTTKDDCGNKSPLNLTGFTGATAYFAAASGGRYYVTGSLVSADLGRLSFALNEVDTAALESGTELNVEIEVNRGTDKLIAQILGKLEVAERLFS